MFPEDWPVGCPPEEATDANGTYFLLIGSDPPNPDGKDADARSKCEKKGGDFCNDCDCCGISVFPNIHDARAQYHFNRRWCSEKLAKRIWCFVASASLQPAHGVVRVIGGEVETHTNWWPQKDLDVKARCGLFRGCEPTVM